MEENNKNFGFEFELDDFQKEAMEHICAQRSVVVCAPTGAGKTTVALAMMGLLPFPPTHIVRGNVVKDVLGITLSNNL